jgi:hypothetical protein
MQTNEKLDYLTFTHEEITKEVLLSAFEKIPKGENLLRIYTDDEATQEELEKISTFKRISPHYKNHFFWFYGAAIATCLYSKEKEGLNHSMLINVSGQGMEVFRSFGYSDLDILKKFHELGFKCTRLDFALDFYQVKTWQEIEEALNDRRYITKTSSMNTIKDPIKQELETIYLGSQKNREILLCLYDKRKEQNKKILMRNKKEGRHDKTIKKPWYRLEMRLYNGSKNAVCNEMFKAIVLNSDTEEDLNRGCRGKILKFFRFIKKGEFQGFVFEPKKNAWGKFENGIFKREKNPRRLKTDEFWAELLGNETTKLKGKTTHTNYEKFVDSFNIQVSKRFLKRSMATWTEEQRQMIKSITDFEEKKRFLWAIIATDEQLYQDLFDYGVNHWSEEDQAFVDQVLIPSMTQENKYPHKPQLAF